MSMEEAKVEEAMRKHEHVCAIRRPMLCDVAATVTDKLLCTIYVHKRVYCSVSLYIERED